MFENALFVSKYVAENLFEVGLGGAGKGEWYLEQGKLLSGPISSCSREKKWHVPLYDQ